MSIDWTAEVVERVRRLYVDEGKSATQTAALMGGEFTKSAIVGKAHRMGWFVDPARWPNSPGRQAEQELRRRVATGTDRIKRPRPAKPPKPPKQIAASKPLPQMGQLAPQVDPIAFRLALRAQCSWPVGPADEEPTSEMLICAAPVDGDCPYCAAHLKLSRSGRKLKPLKLGMFGLAEVGHERRRVA
jgi:GcrA cell cycle regulator